MIFPATRDSRFASRYTIRTNDQLQLPPNDEREQMLEQLERATDANTRPGAIDTAIRRYLESKENREEHLGHIPLQAIWLLNISALKVNY